ncbi:MAG: hypothetical protein ACLQU3_18585 [Limisphaerales bacterium]
MKAAILTLLLSAALVCAGTPPEFSVKLGGKARNLTDIEHLIREYVAKQKLSFDFNGCKKRVTVDTDSLDGVEVFLTSRDGSLALGAAIDKNAKVTRCNIIPICGGAHSEGPTNQIQRTRR